MVFFITQVKYIVTLLIHTWPSMSCRRQPRYTWSTCTVTIDRYYILLLLSGMIGRFSPPTDGRVSTYVRWIITDNNKELLELQSCPLELELKFTPNIYIWRHTCLCICLFVSTYRVFIEITRNLCYVFEDPETAEKSCAWKFVTS